MRGGRVRERGLGGGLERCGRGSDLLARWREARSCSAAARRRRSSSSDASLTSARPTGLPNSSRVSSERNGSTGGSSRVAAGDLAQPDATRAHKPARASQPRSGRVAARPLRSGRREASRKRRATGESVLGGASRRTGESSPGAIRWRPSSARSGRESLARGAERSSPHGSWRRSSASLLTINH